VKSEISEHSEKEKVTMNEQKDKNIISVIEILGEIIRELRDSVESKRNYITYLERKLEEAKNSTMVEQIVEQEEYIKHLEAKVYDLEERVAIMTESEAPLQPEWDITPPAKEVTEVINRTEVIEGECNNETV
jgi:predicted RNase H-like nuclease (RuvC/YqgF family)